jgi:L-fuconolactonase
MPVRGFAPQGVDAHALVVSEDRARYPLSAAGSPLLSADLDPFPNAPQLLEQLGALGLISAVLVQRVRLYGFDNSYICDMAAAHPQRLRAVCAIDARDPRSGEHASYWLRTRGGHGIRLMEPVKGGDLSWLDGGTARHPWRVASDLNLPVAVHFFPWNRAAGLATLANILREFPRVAVILDGVSGISVEAGPPEFGIDELLRSLAEFERVYAKVTDITLSRIQAKGTGAQFIRRLIQLFGAERVMWGSDRISGVEPYSGAVARARTATESLSENERTCFLYSTAAYVYGFPNSRPTSSVQDPER